jgi:hypothetical protein
MTEDRERDENPYRSPSQGASLNEPDGSCAFFGLKEPILAEGTRSEADTREALAVIRGPRRRSPRFSTILVNALLFGLVLASLATKLSLVWLAMGTLLVLSVGGLLVFWIIVAFRRSEQKEVEDLVSTAAFAKITITEKAVSVLTDAESSTTTWERFGGYRCTEKLVVLFLGFSNVQMVFPKSFFAEDAWATFVELVRCKLPEQDLSRPADQDIDPRPSPRLDSEAETTLPGSRDDASYENEFLIGGTLSPAEVLQAGRSADGSYLLRVMPLLFVGLLSAGIIRLVAGDRFELWHLIPVGVGIGAVIVISFVAPRLQLRKQWRAGQGFFEPLQWMITDDFLRITTPTSSGTMDWSGFSKYTLPARLLLLHNRTGRLCYIIPRSFFANDDEWNNFLRFIEQKLGGSQNGEN